MGRPLTPSTWADLLLQAVEMMNSHAIPDISLTSLRDAILSKEHGRCLQRHLVSGLDSLRRSLLPLEDVVALREKYDSVFGHTQSSLKTELVSLNCSPQQTDRIVFALRAQMEPVLGEHRIRVQSRVDEENKKKMEAASRELERQKKERERMVMELVSSIFRPDGNVVISGNVELIMNDGCTTIRYPNGGSFMEIKLVRNEDGTTTVHY